jgi:hypothetical protein
MKTLLLLLALGTAPVLAQAQTVPFDPSAPMRGGAQNQTVVPPVNPALNQSTIQGPTQVQRTQPFAHRLIAAGWYARAFAQ